MLQLPASAATMSALLFFGQLLLLALDKRMVLPYSFDRETRISRGLSRGLAELGSMTGFGPFLVTRPA
jgi:hypothetical protein